MNNLNPVKFSIIMTSLAAVCLLTACGNKVTNPNDINRIVINNDEAMLNSRIKYYSDEHVPLYVLENNIELKKIAKSTGFALKLRAEVEPPTLNSNGLHASHVTINGQYAYVSYSTQFNKYNGGVEIYDISNNSRPRIISQALFLDTDISIALQDNGKIYLGGATDSDHNSNFDSPASLEVMPLQKTAFTSQSQRLNLPSSNANDIAIFDNTIYVTSGTSNGTLSILDKNSFSLIEQIKIKGAKAVDLNDKYILVMEGTGTNLHLFDRNSRDFLRTINIGCTNFFQAKAEMCISQDKVYLSAWKCGMKVVDLNTEKVEIGIPAPDGGVCNAVSVDGDLVFMANGSDGLLVAQIKNSGFNIIGRAIFPGSTNFVAALGNQIFIANGKGGIIYMEVVRESL